MLNRANDASVSLPLTHYPKSAYMMAQKTLNWPPPIGYRTSRDVLTDFPYLDSRGNLYIDVSEEELLAATSS